jgi:RNA polymerase sigma-70 factor (ECF subfamily)
MGRVVASSGAMAGGDIADLVAPAVAGEAGAMRRLLVALGGPVLGTARRILRHPADAEEAAQETMIAVVRDLPSLREPAAVVGFATTAAARIAIKIRRKRERDRDRRAAAFAPPSSEPLAPSPADALSARERAERLLGLLDRLPDEQAEALVMRYVLGHEPAEISAATNTAVNTVRSRIRLARASLARQLEAVPELHPAGKDDPDA